MARPLNWEKDGRKVLSLKRGVSSIDGAEPVFGMRQEEDISTEKSSWYFEDSKIEKKIKHLKEQLFFLDKKEEKLKKQLISLIRTQEKSISELETRKTKIRNDISKFETQLNQLSFPQKEK